MEMESGRANRASRVGLGEAGDLSIKLRVKRQAQE